MFDKLMLFLGTTMVTVGGGFSAMALQDGPKKVTFQILGMILSAIGGAALLFTPKLGSARVSILVPFLALLSFAVPGCGGATTTNDSGPNICAMNPIATQCDGVSEASSPLVGSPGYRSQFGNFEYFCNNVWHNVSIDLQVGRAGFTYAILNYVPWVFPDYMGTKTESPVTRDVYGVPYSIPLAEAMDGPYNVAYNTAPMSVSMRHGNDNVETSRATIPSWGLWIYQAGQRPDYPQGVYIFTLDVPAPCAQRVQAVIDQAQTHVTH